MEYEKATNPSKGVKVRTTECEPLSGNDDLRLIGLQRGPRTPGKTEEIQLDRQLDSLKSLPLLVVVDHARAGNNFFKRLFDQHQEILSLTLVGYLYTRVINLFGERNTVEGTEVYDWVSQDSNIRRMSGELTREVEKDLLHIGETPESGLDRERVREVLKGSLQAKNTVTRKDVIVALFLAFALGLKRNVSSFKYLMLDEVAHNDLPNGETLNQRFYAVLQRDFAEYRIIHLVRDPRANFASIRHQYISSFGNMYPIRASKIWRTVWCNSIWLWAINYTNAGSRSLEGLRQTLDQESCCRIRIEDVNSHFVQTMTSISLWLNVSLYEPWRSHDYVVTSCGVPWRGISAFTPHYNQVRDGPLQNDSDEAWRVCRPNPHLNQKWKERLLPREIKIIESVNYEELRDLDYSFLYTDRSDRKWRAVLLSLLPFSGEIPIRREWWLSKRRVDKKLVFLMGLPVSYLMARIMFIQMFLRGKLRAR